MHKYYIPEINLRDIRNNTNLLSNLENKYNKSIHKNSIIISTNGYYKYEKDKLIKYKIIEKNSNIKQNFYKNYNLIGLDLVEKKINETFYIPYENNHIILEKIKFNIGSSKHFLVIEKIKNRIIDLYFLSTKNIDEDCQFFIKDVSSFIEMLICK
jgi:hypothetical protein